MSSSAFSSTDSTKLRNQIQALGEWFHNLDLNGVSTAPNHFLGDFPSIKWKRIAPSISTDLRDATVLDVGCNAGFYSIEMKKRGAKRVVAIDIDDRYLRQARFAADTLGLEIEFQHASVYEIDRIPGKFDYVFFMGVFYHLRYPLFALDTLIKKVNTTLVFQTMLRGSLVTRAWPHNSSFWNHELFSDPDFPAMYFIEHSYADDPTNWWIPNRNAVEAMLRSSGLEIFDHPEEETWLCRPKSTIRKGHYIRDLEMQGLMESEE